MNSSIDLSPHRPSIEPGQIDDLRRRLFGGGSIGPKVPGYELEEELGRGAFGRVYRAFDPRFGRAVAIKVVPVRSSGARVRIEREAHALARLSHPNVVQVYDKGPAGDDAYFLALEYIDGPSLERWLEQAPRSVEQILAKFLDVARGLAAAHEAGLVHRDFKPANAIVSLDERVRVLDFGLVRALDSARMLVSGSSSDDAANDDGHRWSSDQDSTPTGEDPTALHVVSGQPSSKPSGRQRRSRFSGGLEQRLTAVGRFVGTPYYAAPEQYDGQSDARSDQFSFFVALYEALYERRPFRLRRKKKSWVRFINTRVDFRDGPRRVPRWLVRMLRCGLEIDPARRFSSMEAVAQQLHHRLHRHPVRVRTAMLAGAATLVTASVMGVLGMLGEGDLERCLNQRDAWPASWVEHSGTVRAQAPQIAASLDEYADRWQEGHSAACHIEDTPVQAQVDNCLDQGAQRLTALTGWLATAQHDLWDGLRTHPGPRPLAGLIATLPDPIRCVAGEEPRASSQHGEAWQTLLTSRIQLEDEAVEMAAHTATEAIDRARRLGDRSLLVAAEYQQQRVAVHINEPHDLASVLSLLVQALDAGERPLAADIAATSMSLIAGGSLPALPEDPSILSSDDITHLADEMAALRAAEGRHAFDPTVVGWLRYAEGHALLYLGDYPGARAMYREATTLLARAEPPVPAHLLAVVELNEAIAMGSQDSSIHSALSLANRALDTRRAALGPTHPTLAHEMLRVGELHVRLEDFDGAIRHYEEAERIFSELEHPLDQAFMRAEIVYAHWLAARRARVEAKQTKTNGGDPGSHWGRFERRRHLSLQQAQQLESRLPLELGSNVDSSTTPRPIEQARMWSILMSSYLYHPGCWNESLAAARRLEHACTLLDGDEPPCVQGRDTLRSILDKGLKHTPSSEGCRVDPTYLVPQPEVSKKTDVTAK